MLLERVGMLEAEESKLLTVVNKKSNQIKSLEL